MDRSSHFSKDNFDAKLSGLRYEWRADLKEVEGNLKVEIASMKGELRTEMAHVKGELKADVGLLRGEIQGLRGEMKTWMVVLGMVLAVVSSGVGNRVLNLMWPSGASGPLGHSTPR